MASVTDYIHQMTDEKTPLLKVSHITDRPPNNCHESITGTTLYVTISDPV